MTNPVGKSFIAPLGTGTFGGEVTQSDKVAALAQMGCDLSSISNVFLMVMKHRQGVLLLQHKRRG